MNIQETRSNSIVYQVGQYCHHIPPAYYVENNDISFEKDPIKRVQNLQLVSKETGERKNIIITTFPVPYVESFDPYNKYPNEWKRIEEKSIVMRTEYGLALMSRRKYENVNTREIKSFDLRII